MVRPCLLVAESSFDRQCLCCVVAMLQFLLPLSSYPSVAVRFRQRELPTSCANMLCMCKPSPHAAHAAYATASRVRLLHVRPRKSLMPRSSPTRSSLSHGPSCMPRSSPTRSASQTRSSTSGVHALVVLMCVWPTARQLTRTSVLDRYLNLFSLVFLFLPCGIVRSITSRL